MAKKARVWTGTEWVDLASAVGAAAPLGSSEFRFRFNTVTGSFVDPGVGLVNVNNASLVSASNLNVDVLDSNGANISAFLANVLTSTNYPLGTIRISQYSNPLNFVEYSNAGGSGDANKYSYFITYIAGTVTTFPNNTELVISFTRAGDIGAQGPQGDPTLVVVAAKTAAYTVANGDQSRLIQLNGTFTVSIPTDATFNFATGTQINLLNIGTGVITVAAVTPGTTTVNATPGLKLRAQWSSATLIKRAANAWVLVGDLIA